jgi:hypothetical protein
MSTNSDISLNQINISESSSFYQGKCNLKCDYSFLYNLSSCYASNTGANLVFSYDMNPNGNPQASYNGIEYNVYFILISAPSFHLFNGQKASAELTIYHTPTVAGNFLMVSIPIITITDALSSLITPGSQLVNDMIGQAIELAPNENESATLNLPSYSLEFIVPKKRYFTYSDNDANVQWIVYGINNAIQIKEATALQLAKIIPRGDVDNTLFMEQTKNINPPLFMSQNPPLDLKLSSSSDEIYIDCQPTGSSTEETKVTYVSSSSNQNSVMFFIYVIFFLIVLLVIYMIFSYLMHPNKESISFSSIKNQFM